MLGSSRLRSVAGAAWLRMEMRPASLAAIRALTLASFALAKSAERLTRVTTLPWAGSAAECLPAQSRSMPASPAADHEDMFVNIFCRIVELDMLHTWGRERRRRSIEVGWGLPWVPMRQDDGLGLDLFHPLASMMVKSPLAPVIALASAPVAGC